MSIKVYAKTITGNITVSSTSYSYNLITSNPRVFGSKILNFEFGYYEYEVPWDFNLNETVTNKIYLSSKNIISVDAPIISRQNYPLPLVSSTANFSISIQDDIEKVQQYILLDSDVDEFSIFNTGSYSETTGSTPNRVFTIRQTGGISETPTGLSFQELDFETEGFSNPEEFTLYSDSISSLGEVVELPWNFSLGLDSHVCVNALFFDNIRHGASFAMVSTNYFPYYRFIFQDSKERIVPPTQLGFICFGQNDTFDYYLYEIYTSYVGTEPNRIFKIRLRYISNQPPYEHYRELRFFENEKQKLEVVMGDVDSNQSEIYNVNGGLEKCIAGIYTGGVLNDSTVEGYASPTSNMTFPLAGFLDGPDYSNRVTRLTQNNYSNTEIIDYSLKFYENDPERIDVQIKNLTSTNSSGTSTTSGRYDVVTYKEEEATSNGGIIDTQASTSVFVNALPNQYQSAYRIDSPTVSYAWSDLRNFGVKETYNSDTDYNNGVSLSGDPDDQAPKGTFNDFYWVQEAKLYTGGQWNVVHRPRVQYFFTPYHTEEYHWYRYYSTGTPKYVHQNFVVPDGVTSITVEMWGAGGAGGTQAIPYKLVQTGSGSGVDAFITSPWTDTDDIEAEVPFAAGDGGGGGYVKVSINVTPGETLKIYVGGGGHQMNHQVLGESQYYNDGFPEFYETTVDYLAGSSLSTNEWEWKITNDPSVRGLMGRTSIHTFAELYRCQHVWWKGRTRLLQSGSVDSVSISNNRFWGGIGGAGGGFSAIQRGETMLAVAGGGGGGGGGNGNFRGLYRISGIDVDLSQICIGGHGGGGGGNTGQTGQNGGSSKIAIYEYYGVSQSSHSRNSIMAGKGGGGGTQSAGGTGGAGTAPGSNNSNTPISATSCYGYDGENGSYLQGGQGTNSPPVNTLDEPYGVAENPGLNGGANGGGGSRVDSDGCFDTAPVSDLYMQYQLGVLRNANACGGGGGGGYYGGGGGSTGQHGSIFDSAYNSFGGGGGGGGSNYTGGAATVYNNEQANYRTPSNNAQNSPYYIKSSARHLGNAPYNRFKQGGAGFGGQGGVHQGKPGQGAPNYGRDYTFWKSVYNPETGQTVNYTNQDQIRWGGRGENGLVVIYW